VNCTETVTDVCIIGSRAVYLLSTIILIKALNSEPPLQRNVTACHLEVWSHVQTTTDKFCGPYCLHLEASWPSEKSSQPRRPHDLNLTKCYTWPPLRSPNYFTLEIGAARSSETSAY